MTTQEKFARALISFGLSFWILSVVGMIMALPLKDEYPNLDTITFTTSIITQGIWFLGFLWLIYERVKASTSN